MRSLKVTLYANKAVTLPIAYNELIQGVLYSCWRDYYPGLHDEGFGKKQGFRPFTFGRLEGASSVSEESRTIRFFDLVSFEVRSPVEELMGELASQLAQRSSVRLGAYEFELVNLECCDRLLYPTRCVASLKTPVVVQSSRGGDKRALSPLDDGWLEIILANASRKAEAMGLECEGDLQVIPIGETLRKQVTRFKGSYVTGWLGDIILGADPTLVAVLWCLGLGSKNAQGFGMFDIVDKPL